MSDGDMSDGESQWVLAAQRGDHAAFRRLVEAHARAVYGICFRILGEAVAAEDAVQETMISAYRALGRFDGRSAFATWLHRIAVNAALMIRRGRRPEQSLDDERSDPGAGLVDPQPSPVEHAQAAGLGASVQQALHGLTTMERTAFVLRHIEQFSLDEIGAAMGMDANRCKQAIFRAVRKLRPALAAWRSEA